MGLGCGMHTPKSERLFRKNQAGKVTAQPLKGCRRGPFAYILSITRPRLSRSSAVAMSRRHKARLLLGKRAHLTVNALTFESNSSPRLANEGTRPWPRNRVPRIKTPRPRAPVGDRNTDDDARINQRRASRPATVTFAPAISALHGLIAADGRRPRKYRAGASAVRRNGTALPPHLGQVRRYAGQLRA